MIQLETAQVSTISETKYRKKVRGKNFSIFSRCRLEAGAKVPPATTWPRPGVLDPDPSLRGETYRTWPIVEG